MNTTVFSEVFKLPKGFGGLLDQLLHTFDFSLIDYFQIDEKNAFTHPFIPEMNAITTRCRIRW